MLLTQRPQGQQYLGRVNESRISPPWYRPAHWSPTWRLLAAFLLGVVAWALSPAHYQLLVRLVIGWDTFGVLALTMLWLNIYTADAKRIRAVAASEDLSRFLSFLFVLVAAGASLLAVVILLSTSHGLSPAVLVRHIGLSVVAVSASWLLVHTVFTLRYAHIYYDADEHGHDVGGLDFPGGAKEPDYLDIAYFAFVIGMTAQTADVSISGYRQRRLALAHGLLSFSFNTALLALVVSGVGGIL
jgi:uncharacterized membrane protein